MITHVQEGGKDTSSRSSVSGELYSVERPSFGHIGRDMPVVPSKGDEHSFAIESRVTSMGPQPFEIKMGSADKVVNVAMKLDRLTCERFRN